MFVGSVGMATAAVIATSGTRKYAGGEPEERKKKPKPKKPSIFKRIAMAFRRVIQQQRDVYSSQSMNEKRKRQSL